MPPAGERAWRLPELLAKHGWTALFVSLTIVAFRIDTASFELTSFKGRIVSNATAEGISIAARTSLFTTSVALFALLFAASVGALRLACRWLARGTDELLEAVSIAGCCLWLVFAFALPVVPLISLVAASLTTLFVIGWLDRWILGEGTHPERAAYLASLGLISVGAMTLAVTHTDPTALSRRPWWSEWGPAALVLLLHLLVRGLTFRRTAEGRRAASSALMSAAMPLCWLPLVWVLRDELYLTANRHGWMTLRPLYIESALLAALAIWGAVRVFISQRRGAPPALERDLWRVGFPAFLFSLVCYTTYQPFLPLTGDLFEPGNPGLFVQQWRDFGRVPFVETFNAHALKDSLWGFLYKALQGDLEANWQFYDFVGGALSVAVIYAATRRFTANGYVAFFVAGLWPFKTEVFPRYCELALVTVLVLDWLIAKPVRWRWIVFAFYCAAILLWRLDMGFASAAASAAFLVAWRLVRADFRPRVLEIALAGGLCAATLGGAFFLIAYSRDVDPLARLRDLAHVLSSNQSFGLTTIAPSLTPNVLLNLGLLPLAVLALLAVVLWRERTRAGRAPTESFLVLFIVWGSVYYFANFPRGLVRHSWMEQGNVYVLSFALAVLGSSVRLLPWPTRRLEAAAFLLVTTLLAGCFGVLGPLPQRADKFQAPWSALRARQATAKHVRYFPQLITRTKTPPLFEAQHYSAFRDFTARMLAPEQTFLDLENSPMLYVATGRRSPHYLNHLYLAYDEYLQKRELEEIQKHDVPFVVVWTEEDLAKRDNIVSARHNSMDQLGVHIRQWRLHEWLNAGYEPWCVVQRWQIWRRLNWAAPAPPGTEEETQRAATREFEDGTRIARLLGAEPLKLSPGTVGYVRIDGRAQQAGEVLVRCKLSGAETKARERTLQLPMGDKPLFWTLPAVWTPQEIESLELDFSAAPQFSLTEVSLNEVLAPDHSDIFARAIKPKGGRLGRLPWIWANLDTSNPQEQPTLVELLRPREADSNSGEFRIAAASTEDYLNGIHRREAGFLLDRGASGRAPAVGVRLRFAASGVRAVARVEGDRVFVSGAPLDPVADGPPNSPRRVAAIKKDSEQAVWNFEPLPNPRTPCYLLVQLDNHHSHGEQTGVLHWGVKGVVFDRIDFRLEPGVHSYLFRMNNHYNWTRAPIDWIRFTSPQERVEALAARLLQGD